MAFLSSRREQGSKILYIFKNRISTTVNFHAKSSESNNLNTSNNDNFIGNSNLPRINVQTESSFNTLITFRK